MVIFLRAGFKIPNFDTALKYQIQGFGLTDYKDEALCKIQFLTWVQILNTDQNGGVQIFGFWYNCTFYRKYETEFNFPVESKQLTFFGSNSSWSLSFSTVLGWCSLNRGMGKAA